MEKQWEKSSSNNRSSNEDNDVDNENRSFQSIGKESRAEQYDDGENARDRNRGDRSSASRMDTDSNGQDQCLSNMAYNWVTFVKNKAQAVKAYEQYISDAEKAGSEECAELFRKACKADLEQLGEARQHLAAVLKETAEAE